VSFTVERKKKKERKKGREGGREREWPKTE
jgi:hypothetical protein